MGIMSESNHKFRSNIHKLFQFQFIKFLLVGGVNTIFGYGVFVFFIWIGLHYTFATLVATILGILFNFKSYGILVFKNKSNRLLWRYISVYIFLYILNNFWIYAFTRIKVTPYISGMLWILPNAIIGFILIKRIVFANISSEEIILKNLFYKLLLLFDNEKLIISFSFFFLVLLSLPLFILGGDCPYLPWDSLDCAVAWRKVLVDNNILFATNYTIIPQVMSGVPRASLGSELSLLMFLAYIFPSAYSLAVNRFLQIMIGFLGMYLLCRKYLIKNHTPIASVVVALLFAILPFHTDGCLSIAMQPLILYSFLRIRDKKHKIWDWLVIAIYPFCSIFITWGFFFIFFLFVIFCLNLLKNKKINWNLFAALAVLLILGLITQYREILVVFTDNGYVSHRTESTREQAVLFSFKEVLSKAKTFFFHGQGHVPSNHYYILYFIILFIIFRYIIIQKMNRRIIVLLTAFITICFYASITKWQPVFNIVYNIHIFRLINIERFYSLFPLLLFIIFAYTLNDIPRFKYSLLLFILIFGIQLHYSLKNDYTYYGLWKKYIRNSNISLTFNEFYSEDLFKNIKMSIGIPTDSYRVAALGFHPSVLFYNGFYTIDGYLNNYNLKYKHLFGELIRKELDKNNRLQIYFDKWGNRCYLLDDENGFWFGGYRTPNTRTTSLDVRYDILNNLNCQYIISCVEIENLNNSLELQNIFENNVYKIYLYKVI